ncbi:MAG: hypothetical protein ABR507_02695 [Actinomycetota bacterium]|nr:DUF11 domain-containing protein [Actinomycetota bacterium]
MPLKRLFFACLVSAFVACFLVGTPAYAATTLSAEIVSWQVIGLDVTQLATSKPELFMVQAKVTNTGTEPATTTEATLALGSVTPTDCGGGPCIFLVSSPTYSIGTLAPGATADAFWTVRVVKSAAAVGTDTAITVTASAANAGSVLATQVARSGLCAPDTPGGVLHVESLISQNRNQILSYSVSPGTQRADGSWDVVEGSTFVVTVLAHTATTFQEISVPAIVDPSGVIVPVATDFTFQSGGSDDDIYTLNAGGDVTSLYGYRASSVGDVSLSQLILDCSGSSFHYNSDYGTAPLIIHVVGAPVTSLPVISLTKTSSPKSNVDPGATVTYTIAYSNTGAAATNFVISDVVDSSLSSVVPANGGVFDGGNRTITWIIGSLAAGAKGSVSFTATVDDPAGGKTIANLARGDADGIDPVSSPRITLTVNQTLPNTGIDWPFQLIMGWSSIGFGLSLAGRRLPRSWFRA